MKKNLLLLSLPLLLISCGGGASSEATPSSEASSSEEISSSIASSESENPSIPEDSSLEESSVQVDLLDAFYGTLDDLKHDNATFSDISGTMPTVSYFGDNAVSYLTGGSEIIYLGTDEGLYSCSKGEEDLEVVRVEAARPNVFQAMFYLPSDLVPSDEDAFALVDDHIECTDEAVLTALAYCLGYGSVMSQYASVFTSGALSCYPDEDGAFDELELHYEYGDFSYDALVSEIGTTYDEIISDYVDGTKEIEAKESWTDAEIEAIKAQVEGDEALPLPTGLSALSYHAFTSRATLIYDYGKGNADLVASYGEELTAEGWSKDERSSSSTSIYCKARTAENLAEGQERSLYMVIFGHQDFDEDNAVLYPYGRFMVNYYAYCYPANFADLDSYNAFLAKRVQVNGESFVPAFPESEATGYTFKDSSASQVISSAGYGNLGFGHFAVLEAYFADVKQANKLLPTYAGLLEKAGYDDTGATLSEQGYLAFSDEKTTFTLNVIADEDNEDYKAALHIVVAYQ